MTTTQDINKTLSFEKGNQWAEIEIKLQDGKLSICGSMGDVLTTVYAKKEAFERMASFFDDQPEEILAINKRFNKRFTSSNGCAKFVLELDGEYAGLDVHKEDGNKVYTTHSCGQCIDSIAKEFPSFPNIELIVSIWEKYHLNDMKAGTPEQEEVVEAFRKLNSHLVTRQITYTEICEYLKSKNLLEVFITDPIECSGGTVQGLYKYGSKWLHSVIPQDVINQLETL